MTTTTPQTTTHALVRKSIVYHPSELADSIADLKFRLGFFGLLQRFGPDATPARAARILAERLDRPQVNALVMALVQGSRL